MLNQLHIENIAVIKTIDVTLGHGFTVFTGQTGAGKSVIVNSLKLLTGEKAKADMIRTGEKKAFVSAVFSDIGEESEKKISDLGIEITDGQLMLSREINDDGKSVCRCDMRPIPAYLLREISSYLINVHGQHASQQLLRAENHLSYLDAFAECDEEKHRYRLVYDELSGKKRELSKINTNEAEKRRKTEYLNVQIKEIDAAKLKKNEESELEEYLVRLKNADKLAKYVRTVVRALSASEKNVPVSSLLQIAAESLNGIYSLTSDERAKQSAKRLSELMYEVDDISQQTKALSDGLDENPTEALDKVQSRLEKINELKKKYGSSVEEILEYRENAAAELESITASGERAAELKKEISSLSRELVKCGEELSRKRRCGGEKLSKLIEEKLRYLDMKKVRFAVGTEESDTYTPNGRDKVEFLISANLGQELKPLSTIASGGELSRTMLAIKSVFGDKECVETVLYDEIDTGISGSTSEKIGRMLHSNGRDCQVIAITHSAQIASCADTHFLIYKGEYDGADETRINMLDEAGRIEELSRIIGGEFISNLTRNAAKEMIDNNRRTV